MVNHLDMSRNLHWIIDTIIAENDQAKSWPDVWLSFEKK